jgi:hypothetical protein
MGIYDSFFALPFGKIGVYGLIRPDFVVWALGSYILALPPGINWYKLYSIRLKS